MLFTISLIITGCDTISSGNITPSANSNNCDEFAKSMIPQKITFFVSSTLPPSITDNYDSSALDLGKNKWNDGTSITSNTYFVKGNSVGENTNYFYSYNYVTVMPVLVKTNGTIRYTKRVITDNGDILGDTTFGINVVLKPIPNEVYRWQADCFGNTCYSNLLEINFSIVSYKIMDCTYIKK